MRNTIILLLTSLAGCSSPTVDIGPQSLDGETVEEFVLAAGESRPITIESSVPLRVGIEAEELEPLPELGMYQMAIELDQLDVPSPRSVSTVHGASNVFRPINGQLRFICRNLIDVPMKVRILKEQPE